MKSALEQFFSIAQHQTSIQKEILAGVTTFITMAYIIFVNPQMMAQSGMDYGAIFVGTCLAAAFACLFMGLYANWPVGLAPGMGLNAFFYIYSCRRNGLYVGSSFRVSFYSRYPILYYEHNFSKKMDARQYSNQSKNRYGCWSWFIHWFHWT